MAKRAHAKMLTVTDYQRNANQNYNDISPHTAQNGCHQKNLPTINIKEEDMEKREPSHTVGENANWYSQLRRTVCKFLYKKVIQQEIRQAMVECFLWNW